MEKITRILFASIVSVMMVGTANAQFATSCLLSTFTPWCYEGSIAKTSSSVTGIQIDSVFASLKFSTDLIVVRDAANILGQRNGVNAQELRIWNTDGAQDEFLSIGAINTVGQFNIEAEQVGGGTVRGISIASASGTLTFFNGTPVVRAAANADTAAATLAALETEVNQLKQLLRDYNLMAP